MMTLSVYSSDMNVHRETSILPGELPEESDQFCFLRDTPLANLKVSVGLILSNDSTMRVTIPIDLSTCHFIPPPHFFNSGPHVNTMS